MFKSNEAMMCSKCRAPIRFFALAACLLAPASCVPQTRVEQPEKQSAPNVNSATASNPKTPDPTTHRLTLEDLKMVNPDDATNRWVRAEKIIDGEEGGWVTGAMPRNNKVVIETHGLSQVAIDLARLPVDWDRRVIFRIDGHTSELTRAHYPTLRLRRSPTGGWLVVKE